MSDIINILDKGFVKYVDRMGYDSSVTRAARVSFTSNSAGGKWFTEDRDRRLIQYLIKHGHWSPFEHAVLSLHVKAPIFVLRQWMRHKSQSFNEISYRYSTITDEYYIPCPTTVMAQHPQKKQCSDPENILPPEVQIDFCDTTESVCRAAQDRYNSFCDKNVSREMNRITQPQNIYSEMYVTASLRSWFHFVQARLSTDAQYEIYQYASGVLEKLHKNFPICTKAFIECEIGSMKLTCEEVKKLNSVIDSFEKGSTIESKLK